MAQKLVFGCGYLGFPAAQRWLSAHHQVYAVTRSAERANQLQKLGLCALVADVTDPPSLVGLPAAETVFYAVGFDRSAGKTIRQVYVDGLQNVLAALPRETKKIIYVSSTGVYGQTAGEWVDENAPCHPSREGGRACLDAERLLQNSSWRDRTVILRMGGLYGPGRIPRRSDLAAGRPLAAPEHGYLNLIHLEDAVAAVLAADSPRTPTPAVYNVTDGRPVLRGEYFRELARLAKTPPPRFEPPPAHDPRTQRAASDKRVSNAKMLAELCVTLQYPTYREGLAAILAADSAQPPT